MNPIVRWAGLIGIYFKERLHFRFDFFMTLVAAILYSIMYYMVWRAVFASATSFAMSWQELITYVMIGQAVNMARYSPAERRPAHAMGLRIQNGDIALDLLRPMSFQGQRFIEGFSYFLTEMLWVNIPMLLMFVVFLGISPPASIFHLLAFVGSMLLAFFVNFGLNIIIMTLGFWTRNVYGTQVAKRAIVDIFAGTLIPFELFPSWFRVIVDHLPFKGIAYIPLSIWTGRIAAERIVPALIEQAIWGIVLLGIALLVWRKAARIITIQGG